MISFKKVFIKLFIAFYLSVTLVLTFRTNIINRWGNINDYKIATFSLEEYIFILLISIIILFISDKVKYKCKSFEKECIFKINILIVSLMLLFSWLPYFLTFFPGTGMQDELLAMKYPFAITNQPVFYNILLNTFLRFGKYLGNPERGIALLTIIQACIMASSLAYFLYWLNKHFCPKWILLVIFLIFAFLPIFPNYAISLVKDKLFAVIILLLTLRLYDFSNNPRYYIQDKYWQLQFIFLTAFMIIIRSNGLFIFIPLVTLMIIKYKSMRKKLLSIAIIALLIGMSQTAYMHYGLKAQTPFKESMGIPIQQLGRSVAAGENLPDDTKKMMNKVMPYEMWGNLYRPYSPDYIKWNKNFNSEYLDKHKNEFLKIYLKTIPYNFSSFIEAYLFETYGYWSVFTWDRSQSVFPCSFTKDIINLSDPLGKINDVYHLGSLDIIPLSAKECIGRMLVNNSYYMGAGTCVWITFFISLICIFRKEENKLISLLPILFCWGTLMLSAPISFAFRYLFSFAFLMPFILVLPFLKIALEPAKSKK